MWDSKKLEDIAEKLRKLKQLSEELDAKHGDIQCVRCNMRRVIAALRILELNFCDILKLNNKEGER